MARVVCQVQVDKAVVVVGTTNKLVFSGIHFSLYDKAKWIAPGQTCSTVPDDEAAGGSTAVDTWFDFNTHALVRNFASDQHTHATFHFTTPGVGWQLCFKFDTEQYVRRVALFVALDLVSLRSSCCTDISCSLTSWFPVWLRTLPL